MYQKNWQKNVLRNPGRALEIKANIGSSFESGTLKAAFSSLLEVINFYAVGKWLYFGTFV